MTDSGWVKLHRELADKAIWQESTPEQKTILITLLMMANHQEKEWEWKGEKYKAEPGQFVTSLPSIVKKCGKGITMQNVRTALARFEKYEFLTCQSTNRNRLVTIVNWGLYQARDDEPNRQPNRQLTGNQQAANRQLTANKNDKNDKKINESNMNVFIPPPLEEVITYCQERNKGVDPQKWYDFYSAKGWMIGKNKMKDWKAAVRTWESKDKPPENKSKYDDIYL